MKSFSFKQKIYVLSWKHIKYYYRVSSLSNVHNSHMLPRVTRRRSRRRHLSIIISRRRPCRCGRFVHMHVSVCTWCNQVKNLYKTLSDDRRGVMWHKLDYIKQMLRAKEALWAFLRRAFARGSLLQNSLHMHGPSARYRRKSSTCRRAPHDMRHNTSLCYYLTSRMRDSRDHCNMKLGLPLYNSAQGLLLYTEKYHSNLLLFVQRNNLFSWQECHKILSGKKLYRFMCDEGIDLLF